MSKIRLPDWIQIFTGFALLVGLALVVIEMYQARLLATLELLNEGYAENFAFKRQIMGDNPAPILTKACLNPAALTDAEMTVVLAYFDYRYDSIVLNKLMADLSGDTTFWRPAAKFNLRLILSTKLGRVDYEAHKNDPNSWDPEIAEIAESIMENPSDLNCQDLYKDLRAGLDAS